MKEWYKNRQKEYYFNEAKKIILYQELIIKLKKLIKNNEF